MSKRKTVAEDIAKQLEGMIAEGVLEVGQKLPPERVLSERLQVSRPSIREAKQILISKGLLSSKQGGGTYVEKSLSSDLSNPLTDLLKEEANFRYDVLEVRCSLDSQAAYSAALRATDEDKAKIRVAFDRLSEMHAKGDDPIAEAKADTLFHLSIAEASHNVVLLHIMRSLFEVLQVSIEDNLDKFYSNHRIGKPLHEQHSKLMQAVVEGRAEDAKAAANEHLKFVEESIHGIDAENERLSRSQFKTKILGG